MLKAHCVTMMRDDTATARDPEGCPLVLKICVVSHVVCVITRMGKAGSGGLDVSSDLQAGLAAARAGDVYWRAVCTSMVSNTQQPFRVHGLFGLQLHFAETTKSRASRTQDSSTEDDAGSLIRLVPNRVWIDTPQAMHSRR